MWEPEQRGDNSTTPVVRFPLMGLLALTAMVAVFSGVVFQLPDIVAVPMMLLIVLAISVATLVTLVYGDRHLRTFALGAIVPAALATLALAMLLIRFALEWRNIDSFLEWNSVSKSLAPRIRALMMLDALFAVLLGMLAVWTRLLVEPRKSKPSSSKV